MDDVSSRVGVEHPRLLRDPVEIDRTPEASLAQHAALDFDFTQTYVVDTKAALADIRASRFEISLLFRIPQQEHPQRLLQRARLHLAWD